jgi:hypothetical protein
MDYAVKMASRGMIYMPSFTKINAGVQAILRLSLRNLRVCNVGFTDWEVFMNYAVEMGLGNV